MKLNKSTLKRLIKEEIQKSKLNLKEADADDIAAAVAAVMANAETEKVDLKKLDRDADGEFEEEVVRLMGDTEQKFDDDAKDEVIDIIRNKLGLQVSLESKRLTKESLKAFVRDVIQEITMDDVEARAREMEYDGEVAPEDEPKWKIMARDAAKAAFEGDLMPDYHRSHMKYSPNQYAPAFKAALTKLQNP